MTAWKKWTKWLTGWACAALAALVLALALPPVNAASYMQPYLDKVVDWGVMRGDLSGNLNEDGNISRAEFVAMVNRAFGYTKTGPTPFQDIEATDWYAEDVGIAYNIGYITGTSANRFSPNASVTREQAAVILARIMMLPAQTGENTLFSDSRNMASWSRGLIEAAALYGLVNGYPDGTFAPQASLSRGQAAILLVNALGTPLLDSGDYTLGDVWGNVTITQSDTVLRNTVIGGNLYISAGVDLGDVLLENVTVLGEIVICGGGVSESGDDSIILRNVDAGRLVVDNMTNQLVSLRVEGYGTIADTTIRTNAYVVDQTGSDYGLNKINFAGEEGLSLTLSGNVKTVLNTTPGSTVNLAKGQAQVITMDEYAVDSTLNISPGAVAGTVNLDTATEVTGSGDIDKIYVNADGSTVTMLPDQIEIRPGNTAEINGEVMDNQAAAEASSDPRLNAGYPRVKDLAPTSATIEFMGNKKGTVYWAVTAVTDGSLSADQLINPSSYSPKVVLSGTSSLTGANQAVTAALSKLTSDGSYYLSAVMVDAREQRSPLKVISFTTPDDTKPDFTQGYPYLSKITHNAAQATVMANKTCRLYYAVLLKGAAAPTGDDFKANAVTGNLGFGTMDVEKNNSYTIQVNNVPLAELEDYDLYLWLTDVDGAQSSAVKKLSFTTVDGTPPVFNTEPTVNKVDKTSVGLYANLNEDGTLYWVVVAQGEEYPKPLAGQTNKVSLSSLEAKVQVMNGMNAFKSGKVTMTENKDTTFTVSGLEAEKAYDLYYVAQDKAGNYSATVGKITIHTLDSTAPTVTQEFTKFNGTDTTMPLPETDIRLIFSESIQDAQTNVTLLEYYQRVTQSTGTAQTKAREELGTILRNSILMYTDIGDGLPQLVTDPVTAKIEDKANGGWIIDYRYATVTLDEGKTVVTFPTSSNIQESALNLQSGAKYYFEIAADTIADTSNSKNVMGKTTLTPFTTVFAQINLTEAESGEITVITNPEDGTTSTVTAHAVWQMHPVSTEKVVDDILWDMLIWTDTNITFNLYYREDGTGNWTKLNKELVMINTNDTTIDYEGVSLTTGVINENPTYPQFKLLNELDTDKVYEYAIEFKSVKGMTDPAKWNGQVNIKINLAAGSTRNLRVLSTNLTHQGWLNSVKNGDVTNIGPTEEFILKIPFVDQSIPDFANGYPYITEQATTATMRLGLTGKGRIYYVVAPVGEISTEGYKLSSDHQTIFYGDESDQLNKYANWNTLPDGDGVISEAEGEVRPYNIIDPLSEYILNPGSWYVNNPAVKYGNIEFSATIPQVELTGLIPETKYIAYFILQNTSQKYSGVLCYRFETTAVGTPYLTLTSGDGSVSIKTSETSYMSYIIATSFDITRTSPLNQTFAATSTDGKNTPLYMTQDSYDAFVKVYGSNSKMTVFEALSTTISAPGAPANEGPSVFDEYANTALKEQIGRLIRQDQSEINMELVTSDNNIAMDAGEIQTPQIRQYLNQYTAYACIAVAYNQDGTLDGFKAIDNITVRDSSPPTMTISGIGVTETSTGSGKWNADLLLTFSEELYWLSSKDGKTLKAVVGSPDASDTTTVGFLDCSTVPTDTTVVNGGKVPTTTFRLRLRNIGVGEQIILFNNGNIADVNSNPRERVIITFSGNIGVIQNPNQTPYFVITQGKLDGDIDDKDTMITP